MRFSEEEWAAFQLRNKIRSTEGTEVAPPPQPISLYQQHVWRLEKEFQSWIIALATKYGWKHYHTHRSDKSPKGWPDLVLAHEARGIVLFRELKLDGKNPTDDQQWWLDMLTATGHDAKVWRPTDTKEIITTLTSTEAFQVREP